MKEWFCCHEESIVIGQEYEPWKIPSGAIVTWESPDRFCDHIMPKQRYAIMMGEQIIEDSQGFILEVRMLEITPIKKMEIHDYVKKEWDWDKRVEVIYNETFNLHGGGRVGRS